VLLQLDVWITLDGHVVVFHDEDLTRMTAGGSTANIAELKYSDLPQIHPNESHLNQSDRCALYSSDECRKIPLLKDVFQTLPKDTCFIIEFKQESSQLISEVHKIILAANRYKHVFWFSLKEKINKNLRAYDPALPTLTSVDNMLKIVMAYYCGLMPFVDIPDKVFGITLDAVREHMTVIDCLSVCMCLGYSDIM
jgi:glycerophosphoryl diester phosphodiesterase